VPCRGLALCAGELEVEGLLLALLRRVHGPPEGERVREGGRESRWRETERPVPYPFGEGERGIWG
jgi:hypothetical protein